MEIQVSVCVCVLGEGPGRARFCTTTSRLPSHHPALSSPCPAWAGGRGECPQPSPWREAKEAQLVRLPRHVLLELVNNGGGGPWHKEVVFSWGGRGGGSLRSPAVAGGWGEPALLLLRASQVHQRDSGGKRESEIN